MKRQFKIILVINLVAFLSGCPVHESILMYNNSGSDVVIRLECKDLRWLAGKKIEISKKDSSIDWESLGWFGDPNVEYVPLLTLQVDNNEKTFKLVFPNLPNGYVSSEVVKEYLLQLERDGALYVVPSGSDFPVTKPSLKIGVEPFRNYSGQQESTGCAAEQGR